jgi:LysM repeat protein
MKLKAVLLLIGFVGLTKVFAQKITPQQYIDTYKSIAIAEMKRMGVPADITLAQGILETESGNSVLVKKSNNHFGIKCKDTWTGQTVSHDDDAAGECFRKYDSPEDSYRDHSNFLRGRDHYAFLFRLDPADYKGWAYGLKKAGYATNPNYPKILIKTIEEYKLNELTKEAVDEIPTYFNEGASVEENNTPTIVKQTVDKVSNVIEKVLPGATKLNGLKVVYAEKGTSLLSVATKHQIALTDLLNYNDKKTDGLLDEGSWIYLEPKRKEGKLASYTTTESESVYQISQLNGIQLSSLIAYNDFKEDDILSPGKLVRLKPDLGTVENKVSSTKGAKIHEVKPKEGLYGIAKKYNITVEQLKAWNDLDSESLSVGQQLIIAK